MDNEIEKFVESFFNKDYSPSQAAEFTAYLVRRICKGVISDKVTTADSSYNSLSWDKSIRDAIRDEVHASTSFILSEGNFPYVLRKTLMSFVYNFNRHCQDNYFARSYLKGMLLDTFEKLTPSGNNEMYFRVRGVLWDVIEDSYTGLINYENTGLPEAPNVAPEN